jgi:1-acyl-sn-glycerol-3-phosphate acyltransferase
MSYLIKALQYIYSIYGFAVFLLLMFILFPFVVLASLFGKIRGGNIVYHICRFWADAAMLFWGIFHKNIYESPHKTDHPVVFVFNHISYMDIPILMKAFRQPIRVLGKAEMAKVPVFGFIYKAAVVLVERSDPAKRAKSVKTLISVLKRNISIVIAPEGTFNTTGKPLKEFYDGAFRVAIETQTPIKPVLFLDAYDRLNPKSIFSLSPGRSRAIFLDEVTVKDLTINDLETLKQKVYRIMEDELIRHNASWIIQK